MSGGGPFLYPNVTSIPSSRPAETGGTRPGKGSGAPGEFEKLLKEARSLPVPNEGLGQIRKPLKFSAHASQRIQDRKIPMDSKVMARVNTAIDKAAAKGVGETLILMDDAALIVSVPNRTVITAMDRGSMEGNVFTNIDGAVIA